MSEFKIDKGIPVPPQTRRGRFAHYPFNEMEIGDSFFVSVEGRRKATVMSNITAAARRGKLKITCRFVVEDGVYGYRVWRVEDETP